MPYKKIIINKFLKKIHYKKMLYKKKFYIKMIIKVL